MMFVMYEYALAYQLIELANMILTAQTFVWVYVAYTLSVITRPVLKLSTIVLSLISRLCCPHPGGV